MAPGTFSFALDTQEFSLCGCSSASDYGRIQASFRSVLMRKYHSNCKKCIKLSFCENFKIVSVAEIIKTLELAVINITFLSYFNSHIKYFRF